MYRQAPASASFAALCAALFFASGGHAAYPPAGRDAFDSMAILRVAVPSLNFPETAFTAVGPTRIRRGSPYDPGDGKIKIDTWIESMSLSGLTPLGSAVLRVIPLAPGGVQQVTAGQDFPALSWFDVKVEIIVQSPIGAITVYSDPDKPVRMMATINDLPPLDAQYQPPETFVGVDLVDAQGNVVGTLAHAGHFVGQQPTFSVGPEGPSGLAPGDLFKRATSPAIRAAQLGLTSGNVDALSYGRDFIFPQYSTFPSIIDLRFSVAKGAKGRLGSDVAREAAKSPPEPHGDEFRVTPFAGYGGGSNVQVLDENGDTAPPFPLQINDELDALTEHPPSFVDDGDGVPDRPVYFSLQAGAPELAALGANGASILSSTRGGPPTVYLSHTDLGLTATDDIDALCLNDTGKHVVFSLAPGSPSLAGRSPADTFMALSAPSTFFPWATAANLGLDAADNVDALKCHIGEVVVSYEAKISLDVLRSGTFSKRISLPCRIELVFGGFDGDAGSQGTSGSQGRFAFYIPSLKCTGTDDGEPVVFTIRTRTPAVLPSGLVFAQRGSDRRLFGAGSGSLGFTPSVDGWGIVGGHGPEALIFFILVTDGFPGDSLSRFRAATDTSVLEEDETEGPQQVLQATPYNLFLEGGVATEFAIDNVLLEWDARVPPAFTAEGFLDSGGYRANPSLGGLASLFGSFATPAETAGAIPLPRQLGDNVQVLFEARPNALREEGDGKQQVATIQVPAPLLFVGPTQINLQIPWEASVENDRVTATVVIDGVRSDPVQLPVGDTSPGVFTADFGSGRAIAINADGTLAQPAGSIGGSHPAAPGDTLVLLVTGLGDTNPPGITGANSYDGSGAFVRRDAATQVRVFIGGAEAQVHFAGLSPEFVGVYQINATVPAGIAAGDAVTLVVEAGGRQSRGDVTIAVAAP